MTKGEYNSDYLKWLNEFLAPSKQRSFELLNATRGELVADIGCGIGLDAATLAVSGATVFGCDRNPQFIESARTLRGTRLSIEFECCEADKINKGNEFFDKARYDRVFQHLENPRSVLREARRIIRPGGLLQIVDTDYASMTAFLPDMTLERMVVDSIAKQRIPNSSNTRVLPSLLEAEKFKVQSVEVYPYVIRDYASACRLIRFDAVVAELFESNQINSNQQKEWNRFTADRAGIFNLVLNMVTVMALRS